LQRELDERYYQEFPFKPQISPYSQTFQSPEPVHERLYKLSSIYKSVLHPNKYRTARSASTRVGRKEKGRGTSKRGSNIESM
jgi:hypothetical protein